LQVEVLDEGGRPIEGFTKADCAPMTFNSSSGVVKWTAPLARLAGRSVHLKFYLKHASLLLFPF